jgi:hypothetical protein
MSIFKFYWANIVIIQVIGRCYERLYVYRQILSQRHLDDQQDGQTNNSVKEWQEINAYAKLIQPPVLLMIFLSLFNNVVAPFLAEAFVSPNCFYYLVNQPQVVTSSYPIISCYADLFTNIYFVYAHIACDKKTNQLSYTAPFVYSFQCSSSLVKVFVYVFVIRYLVSGIILPIIFLFVKLVQEKILIKYPKKLSSLPVTTISSPSSVSLESACTSMETHQSPEYCMSSRSMLEKLIMIMLPFYWRECYLYPPHEDEEEKSSSIQELTASSHERPNSATFYNRNRISSNLRPSGSRIRSFSSFLELTSLSTASIFDHMLAKSAFLVRTLNDLGVFLTFGLLYPPLGIVMVVSMISDLSFFQLALQRMTDLNMIYDSTNSSTNPSQQRSRKLSLFYLSLRDMDVAYADFMLHIQTSFPYVCIIAAQFWAYAIYDTVGYSHGLFFPAILLLLLVSLAPFAVLFILRFWIFSPARAMKDTNLNDNNLSEKRISSVELANRPSFANRFESTISVDNPILDNT